MRYVAEVAQDVESVDGESDACLGEAFGETGVPHEVVGVGAWGVVSPVAVHGEVCGEFYGEGELQYGCHSVVEVPEGIGAEIFASGGDAIDDQRAHRSYGVLAEFVFELYLFVATPYIDGGALRSDVRVFRDIVHAVVHCEMCLVVDGESAFLVECAPVPDIGGESVVAVYVHGAIVSDTGGAVEGIGICQGVDAGKVALLYGEVALFVNIVACIEQRHVVGGGVFQVFIAGAYVEWV